MNYTISYLKQLSFLLFILFVVGLQPVYAICSAADQKALKILEWLKVEQGFTHHAKEVPKVIWYKEVNSDIKKKYCPWCPLAANPQLNMYIVHTNEIWLTDTAKTHQLAHELAHVLQSSGTEGSGSSELENQAVYWQNKYRENYPEEKVCP